MSIYLVRHAQAGKRTAQEDDFLRPLSHEGRFQTERLVERFGRVRIPKVISSPFVRCVQTVAPIAAAHELEVEIDQTLAEERPFIDVIDLLLEVPDHTVLCSHGDVIPETIAALCRRGMEVVGAEDWRKGCVWVLERVDSSFLTGSVEAPPPKR
jgi:8-oxo-dGTP diphosphatase